MIIVYQYLNQQSLTVTSVQQRDPTALSRFLSLSFPLNLKQWCQQRRVRLIMKKHLYKRQKQLYAITAVRWNSSPQMVMHCPKYKTILSITDSDENNKYTLELLLLKCDLHFSFLYKEGLVFCTKNRKK